MAKQVAVGRQRYVVLPVMKALRVLDLVAGAEGGSRLSNLALAVRLPKTTVFRYLCSLEAAGYLACDPVAETWQLGTRFRALAEPPDPVTRMRALALPIMVELRDRFDETVNLGVLRGSKVVYVEIVESNRRLRLQAHVGGEDPAHSTALGRALLAHLPADERAQILAEELTGRTQRTVRTRDAVEVALGQSLKLGYAVERGENEEGAICVGAAIMGQDGRPAAALSLSAPEGRMAERRIVEAGQALRRAARQAGDMLRG